MSLGRRHLLLLPGFESEWEGPQFKALPSAPGTIRRDISLEIGLNASWQLWDSPISAKMYLVRTTDDKIREIMIRGPK